MAHRTRSKSGRFLKGHRKVRRSKKSNPARSRSRRRSKRKNPGMPIMLVNPSGGRKRRTKSRRNPTRRHRRAHRRSTHRNPSSSWKSAFMALGLGGLGGGIMAGVDYGVGMLPVSAPWQIAAVGGAGVVLAVVAAKYGDERIGAGAAGATVLSIVKRGAEAYALSGLAAKPATTTEGAQAEGAGAVYRESGAMLRARGAQSMAPSGAPRAASFRDAGAVYRESGASRYVPGPVRLFGPKSWIHGSEAGRVYRSAHNT